MKDAKSEMTRLTKYQDLLIFRLKSETPDKHKESPDTFHQFLNRELEVVSKKIEALKLEVGTKK